MDKVTLRIRNEDETDWLEVTGGATNLLDSSAHSDTITGSPVKGDLIVAEAHKKWTRLPIGSTDQILKVAGGAPSWATLTLPQTKAAETHKFLTAYDATTGLFTNAQPDYGDLSGVPSTFAIATPGTLTVSTTNVASGNHTHAITSSSDVSAGTSAILASNAGALSLLRLGVGVGAAANYGVYISPQTGVNLALSYFSGIYSFPVVVGTGAYASAAGEFVISNIVSGNQTGSMIGVRGQVNHAGSGTASNCFGLDFSVNNLAAGTITAGYGINISFSNVGGGTIGTLYGLRVQNVNNATTNYAIYTDSGLVHFGDAVLINTATNAGALTVNGEIAIADGMTAPSATVGYRKIFVDTLDSKLKTISGSGTTLPFVLGDTSSDVSAGTSAILASSSGALTLKSLTAKNSVVATDYIVLDSDDNPSENAMLRLYGGNPGIFQQVVRSSGGFAFSIFNLKAYNDATTLSAKVGEIGLLGSMNSGATPPSANYIYFGADSTTAYNSNALRIYAGKDSVFYGGISTDNGAFAVDYANQRMTLGTPISGFSITAGDGTAASDSAFKLNGGTNNNRGAGFAFARGGVDKIYFGTHSWVVGGAISGFTVYNAVSTDPIYLSNCSGVLVNTETDAGALTVNGSIAIADGMTAPSATAGYMKFYVDNADGDLKVVFGDGTVKTIVTD